MAPQVRLLRRVHSYRNYFFLGNFLFTFNLGDIFTARCYASAVLATALCPCVRRSVRPSVCPSQVSVLLKRLNVGSHKQRHTIAQGL